MFYHNHNHHYNIARYDFCSQKTEDKYVPPPVVIPKPKPKLKAMLLPEPEEEVVEEKSPEPVAAPVKKKVIKKIIVKAKPKPPPVVVPEVVEEPIEEGPFDMPKATYQPPARAPTQPEPYYAATRSNTGPLWVLRSHYKTKTKTGDLNDYPKKSLEIKLNLNLNTSGESTLMISPVEYQRKKKLRP